MAFVYFLNALKEVLNGLCKLDLTIQIEKSFFDFHVVDIIQFCLLLIFLGTLCYTRKMAKANVKSAEYQTRPVVGFHIEENVPIVTRILFDAENYSNTDASGIVVLKTKYKGAHFESHFESYNGLKLWHFAANQCVYGNTDLTFVLTDVQDIETANNNEIENINEITDKIEWLLKKAVDQKGGIEEEIRTFVEQNKDYKGIEIFVKIYYWRYNPNNKLPKINKIYESPIKRWKFSLEKLKWIANPTFKLDEEYFDKPQVYLERLRRNV